MKRLRRWMSMGVIVCLMALLVPAETLAADGSTITKVSITLKLDLTEGDPLPDLHIGYSGDNDANVRIGSSTKYDITEAEWTSSTSRDVELGSTYNMKITLEAQGDYYFKGTYRSSNVSVSGGTFVSAGKSGSDKLIVKVKTKPVEGQYASPEEAYWRDSGLGKGRWESVDGTSTYDVWLYRGSSAVEKVNDYKGTSIDFYPYMTREGTYYFKVRAVPGSDSAKKYADKSDWTESDEVYIGKEDVSDGSGQGDFNTGGSGSGNGGPGGGSDNSPAGQVGWIKEGFKWWYRYPDGNFQKDSWLKLNDKWYLFDSDGWMMTGWQKKNEQWYYLNENGAMVTGWLHAANGWYYMNPTKDAFEGAMVKGQWVGYNGQRYYLGGDGIMYEGWKEVDGNWYYFYPGSGNVATNTWIDSFYVDQNGVWVR